jgi:3-methyladenine DNA glycosylase AlkC
MNDAKVITKVSDVKQLVQKGVKDPRKAFPHIRRLAESEDWKAREVAATTLVEISKKRRREVVEEMLRWVEDVNQNVRRAAVEGLRDIARKEPNDIVAVLEKAKNDTSLYVKKSVANILRNAGKRNPDFVLNLCRTWLNLRNPNANWIIRKGLRKLEKTRPSEVKEVLEKLE